MKSRPDKKLLLVTYYWPPAGGPGVQRWLKLCKYLPSLGYDITVCIPENPSYPMLDESLLSQVHPRLRILKFKIWEPYALAGKFSQKNEDFKAGQFAKKKGWKARLSVWIRGNLFIPDARKFWIKPMQRHLKELLTKENFDILITTGPPHSLHLIGLGLKKDLQKQSIQWVADFRDPWTEISYHSELQLSRWAAARHKDLERQVLKQADIVLATSYTDADAFRRLGAGRVETLTNGFDPEDLPTNLPSKKLVIAYIGALEQLRNPPGLWRALEGLNHLPDWEFHFIGKVDTDLKKELESGVLRNRIKFLGYVPHSEAVNAMYEARVLVLTNFDRPESKGIIPGKIFEYLASGAHILSIGPADSDVEKILNKTGAGKHFTYLQVQQIQTFLKETLNQPSRPIRDIAPFSRPELARQLDAILSKKG